MSKNRIVAIGAMIAQATALARTGVTVIVAVDQSDNAVMEFISLLQLENDRPYTPIPSRC